MRAAARAWFERRTTAAGQWPHRRQERPTVDVILPARNEAATVGDIVSEIRTHLMGSDPLIDDVVVVDSGSSDATAAVADAAGARVVAVDSVLTRIPAVPGKGEAMWRGLAATSGDLVVFVDADLRSFTPAYVSGLLGPLLADPVVQLVKAIYDRPLIEGDIRIAAGGGRVTEILARPLINALWPDLAGIAQPLSGEYAARRSLLEQLAFPCGYGVEIGLLVDTYRLAGLDAIAQVDLGERRHRHQDATRLSRMSAQILHAALVRADPDARIYEPAAELSLPVFSHDDTGFGVTERGIQTLERPPLVQLRQRLLR